MSTGDRIYTDVKTIPKNEVGLLLGTAKYKDRARKIINEYYQNRINAAAALYMAGKIDYIIVSGDSSMGYSEPNEMRNDLLAMGVPSSKIFMDNAGFRTLDSVLRCHDIFGQTKFTIISQEFHNRRALFIGLSKQMDVVAFNADDGNQYMAVNFREQFARVRMVMDLITDKKARVYGGKVEIR